MDKRFLIADCHGEVVYRADFLKTAEDFASLVCRETRREATIWTERVCVARAHYIGEPDRQVRIVKEAA